MELVQFTVEPHRKFITEPQSTLTSTLRMVINFCSQVSVVSLKVLMEGVPNIECMCGWR